jgi:hypothetical protein
MPKGIKTELKQCDLQAASNKEIYSLVTSKADVVVANAGLLT